eukprot:14973046-Ditylum_brightwellii.AAC.1
MTSPAASARALPRTTWRCPSTSSWMTAPCLSARHALFTLRRKRRWLGQLVLPPPGLVRLVDEIASLHSRAT